MKRCVLVVHKRVVLMWVWISASFCQPIQRLVVSSMFQWFYFMVSATNTLVLLFNEEFSLKKMDDLDVLELCFMGLFIAEMLLKLVGLGVAQVQVQCE